MSWVDLFYRDKYRLRFEITTSFRHYSFLMIPNSDGCEINDWWVDKHEIVLECESVSHDVDIFIFCDNQMRQFKKKKFRVSLSVFLCMWVSFSFV